MPEPLAIYSAINTSYTLTKELYGLVEAWVKASKEMQSLELKFKADEQFLKLMCEFFKDHEGSIAEAHADVLVKSTKVLQASLIKTRAEINKYNPKRLRRAQWPFVRGTLVAAEANLAWWVGYLSKWFAILPTDLQKEIWDMTTSEAWKLKNDPLRAFKSYIVMKKTTIDQLSEDQDALVRTISPCPSETERATATFKQWTDLVWVPPEVNADETEFQKFKLEIAKLVEVLKSADPELHHIARASSWFFQSLQTGPAFGISYQTPDDGAKCFTLKQLVCHPAEHTINERINLAIQIAKAVAYVHGLGWVHKAIRPDNITSIYDRGDDLSNQGLGSVVLKGFHVARRGTPNVRSTNQLRETKRFWEAQVYQHPRRQAVRDSNLDEGSDDDDDDVFWEALDGNTEADAVDDRRDHVATLVPPLIVPTTEAIARFRYEHDVYSLGVVLLEVGLWKNLTNAESELKALLPPGRRSRLLELADKLPRVLGEIYYETVRACLDVDRSRTSADEVLSNLSNIVL